MRFSPSVSTLVLGCLPALVTAWLPSRDNGMIRGVNLGGLFIIEPWMMWDEWNSMGCGDQYSEFDCVLKLGQDKADAAFKEHWGRWITKADIDQMVSLGLNTVRIPVGYWIYEDIVDRSTEHFPKGGMDYLKKVCDMARAAGLYVIIDLHGGPGAQQAYQSFTGQFAHSVGFYNDYNYERAYRFLEWMTTQIHTQPELENVGAIELINEPLSNPGVASLISDYYPTAFQRIRAAEQKLGIGRNSYLHIQMMNELWGSGNPNANLKDTYFAFYDDHHYVKWTPSVPVNRKGYMQHSCTDSRAGNWPVVTGEWSLAIADNADDKSSGLSLDEPDAVKWYGQWFAAQVQGYEKNQGWIFWSWKVNWINGRDDWRWGYQQAVAAGVIPKVSGLDRNVCKGQ